MSNPFEREKKKRDFRKANRTFKRNRDDRPPRKKRWQIEDFDEGDFLVSERVMPRDERERRRKVERMALRELAETESEDGIESPLGMPAGELGRVIEVSSSLCRVAVDGKTRLCSLRGGLSVEETGYTNVVAVGDQVRVLSDGQDGGVVIGVLPRRNRLARLDSFYGHLHQFIAANLDQLLIVASWRDPVIWAELIDRYLITAQRHNIQPIICINKVDLADKPSDLDEYVLPYQDLGYPVFLTSVVSGTGLVELQRCLSGKVTILAGVSGVGKSSLLSAVEPDFQLKVSQVSETSGEGRHTTTQAVMLPFGAEGYVIDTPGIREFGLRGLTVAELMSYYPDFAPYHCRFRACTHMHEPDCAVIKAVETGTIPAWRYHNYQKIFETLGN